MVNQARRRHVGGLVVAAVMLAMAVAVAQTTATPASAALSPSGGAEQTVAAAALSEAQTTGLHDLAAMTFSCPQAALNAAAREAAQAPTQGTYQFAYFNIVSDAHHAAYEVHFRSNVQSEPSLRYCVALYCQQGWDPRTSKTEVMLMADQPKRGRQPAHSNACGMPNDEERRRGSRR